MAVVAVACDRVGELEPLLEFAPDELIPVVGHDAIYGTVVAVIELDTEGWTSPTINAGGPDSGFLSGSATLRLHAGTLLRIPTGTPAGNACLDLNPWEATLEPVDASLDDTPCTVHGVLTDTGEVEWLAVDGVPFRYEGRDAYSVRLIGFQGPDLAVTWSDRQGVAYLAFRVADGAERRHCDEVEFIEAPGIGGVVASSQSVPGMVVEAFTASDALSRDRARRRGPGEGRRRSPGARVDRNDTRPVFARVRGTGLRRC